MDNSFLIKLFDTNDTEIARYEVNPDVFEKWSLKFKRERKKNPHQIVVSTLYKPNVFKSFVDACQERPFSISEEDAYELLRIAKDWDTPDLVENCKEYIRKNCIHMPYYIIHRCSGYHDDVYPVDATLFSKMSAKFQQAFKEDNEQMTVEDDYSPSVFLSFVVACQQRTAYTSHDEVNDLLSLAQEWGAPQVEKFCMGYINKYGIGSVPDENHLEMLFKRLENKEECSTEMQNVARNINYYLKDESFSSLPTHIFYRILTLAEKNGVDPRSLIECVIKKLKESPLTTVPLILRINFDELTEDEYEQLFGAPQIHEQNINFYTSLSLSSIYENTCYQLDKLNRLFKNDVDKTLQNIDKDAQKIFNKASVARKEDFDRIDYALSTQQARIDDLKKVLASQKAELINAVERAKDIPSNEQLQKRAIFSIKKNITKFGKVIGEIIDDGEAKANDMLNEILDKYYKKLCKAMENLGDKDPSKNPHVHSASSRMQKLLEESRRVNKSMAEVRAFLAAKILRDKLRVDNALRKADKRFLLFEDKPGVWDVPVDAAVQAEKVLLSLEDQLESFRPIESAQNAF